jgi:hypothetical protein
MVFVRPDLNRFITSLILGIKLHKRLRPFSIRFLNKFLRVFEKPIILDPGQIKFPVNNLESLGFYAGSPAEK